MTLVALILIFTLIPLSVGGLIYWISAPRHTGKTVTIYPPNRPPVVLDDHARNMGRLVAGGAIVFGMHELNKKMDQSIAKHEAERQAREKANQPTPWPKTNW
jgi:hypothetical protein